MAAPSLITELSQTAGSNGPDGASTSPKELDNYQRAHASFIAQLRDGKGFSSVATIASATTTTIGAVDSLMVEITGTTTITGLGSTYNGPRFIRFAGVLNFVHSAAIALPGSANIATAAGDTCIAVPNSAGTGWVVLAYQRAATGPTFAQAGANTDITSLAAPALGAATATTAAVDTNTTQVATTAYVVAQSASATPLPETAAGAVGTATRTARSDHIHPARSIGSHMAMVSYFGSRSLGATYTNSQNWPIVVMVSAAQSGGGAAYLRASIPSTSFFLDSALAGGGSGGLLGLTFIVPAGAQFTITCPTGAYATLTNWQQFQ